jgi:serine/threonine protein phosphatase Stp1
MTRMIRASGFGLTHVGCVRTVNEDSMALDDRQGIWVVADGMGGHADGQWASQTVVGAINDLVGCEDFDTLVNGAANAIHTANATIFQSSTERGLRAGSTVVALCIRDGRFACIWAGDSRIYLLRDQSLIQMTHDHTQVQAMVAAGLLSETDAVNHPLSHVLARAVGAQSDLELDAVEDNVEPGDIFLLCSDGLSGLISDEELEQALKSGRFEYTSETLMETTLSRGAPDNVTFVGVRVEETTAIVAGGERSSDNDF